MLVRGKSCFVGTNGFKTSPRAKRLLVNGIPYTCFDLHAEMAAITASRLSRKPSNKDELYVMRFLKSGETTMAKPCSSCQKWIKSMGIKKVYYTNWQGQWERL